MIDDKYTYPGSGGVLINRRGITDPGQLDKAMNTAASRGMAALDREGVPQAPDAAYLRHIHRRLFSPVLKWAGEVRDVNAKAGGTSIAYARPEFIDPAMGDLFGRLARADYFRGAPRDAFADRLGVAWGDLTAIHPFRDGNTRTQSVYVSALAARAGYEVDWPAIDVDQLREVRLQAVTGRDAGLREMLRDHTSEVVNEDGAQPRITATLARTIQRAQAGRGPRSLEVGSGATPPPPSTRDRGSGRRHDRGHGM